MKKKSFLVLMICAVLSLGLCAEAFAVPAYAASKNSTTSKSSTTSKDSSDSKNKNSSTSNNNDAEDSDENKDPEASLGEAEELIAPEELVDAEDEDSASSKNSKKDKSKDSTTTTTTKKTTTRSSGSSGTDSKGNKLLMTESQRRNKFRSKTNPKRGTKPESIDRPKVNGFIYADFGMCNSYNSDNGLGGTPMYLLGTIMDIQKVYENDLYYGTVILVNDCDGYQWYMRTEVSKLKYDQFRKDYLGKAGYIYGRYAGYSGVTNRPMLDITVLQPNGALMTDMKLYR